jgi:1,2-phenylacetyl-CoA epoxidase catalytic subunit
MTDRELMQMALDALDWKLTTLLKKSWENHHIHEVIKALRDRLAQPKREWVGLTEEELEDLLITIPWPQVCRAIEAKLREKNT